MKKIVCAFFVFLFALTSPTRAQSADRDDVIFSVIKDGQPEELEKIIASGKNLEIRNRANATPLFIAAYLVRPEMVAMLLAASSDVHAVADRGMTPLHAAFLIPREAILSGKGIHFEQRLEIVKLLLNAHGDVNARGSRGETPLMVFSMLYSRIEGHREEKSLLFKALLDAGADINAENADSDTPLQAALMGPYEDLALMLLKAGAEIHKGSDEIPSPLHCAAAYGSVEATAFLLEHGARVNQRFEGLTPLHMATGLGLLLYEKDQERQKTLQETLQQTNISAANLLEVTKLLVKYNANITLQSEQKKTALDYAQELGNQEVAAYLKKLEKDWPSK